MSESKVSHKMHDKSSATKIVSRISIIQKKIPEYKFFRNDSYIDVS